MARQLAGVAVVSCHLGCFSHRDLIIGRKTVLKETRREGQEVWSYCMAESRGGSFRWTQGRKARRAGRTCHSKVAEA